MNIVFPLASYHTDSGLSDSGKQRVDHAAEILNSQPTALAIVSGGVLSYGLSDPHYVHVVDELRNTGVSASRIFATLSDATHTIEEAAHASRELSEIEFSRLIVVTSLAHFPRAPFVFAHFFPLDKLSFVFVPDDRAKDVTRFTYFKEAEAYQEQRRLGGVYLGDSFIATNFEYSEFADLLRNRTEIMVPELREHESKITEGIDLFAMYVPHSPFCR